MPERLFLRLPDDPPCAPETTVPASTLREFAVPGAWRQTLAHVTAYEERFAAGVEVVERVLPDGASRLLIGLEGGAASVRVAGASASPVVLAMRGHMHGLSITLNAGATLELFGVPAHELAGQTVAWDELVDPAHRGLPEQLAAAADDASRVRLVLRSLHAIRRAPDLHAMRVMAQAANRLHGGGSSVRALAAGMGLSERRLQQMFAAQLGLAPSVWRRLQRLHATLRLLRLAEPAQWADVALSAGYYDQSHLINEFRALCGLTPQQFLARAVSDSSNTTRGRDG